MLGEGVRRGDPCRWLSSRFIADPAARADVVALYAYDLELTRAPKVTSNALVAEIRLTWWREVLGEIYSGGRVRGHPVAQALAGVIGRRGLPRSPLEAMIDARIAILDKPKLDIAESLAWTGDVAGSTAALAAQILDPRCQPAAAIPAGRLWGLALLRARGLADGARLTAQITSDLPAARAAARTLSVAAFPAVAHAAFARRGSPAAEALSALTQLRLLWAVTTGRV